MRRISNYKKRDKPVSIKVHPEFYKQFDDIRKKLEVQLGNVTLTQSMVSQIISKGGFNIPKDMKDIYNDKKQKRRRY